MRQKPLLAICILAIAICVIVSVSQTQSKSHAALKINPTAARQEVPEHIQYGFLFHHLKILKEKTEELEREGKGRSALLLRLQEKTALSSDQFQELLEVALDCEREVTEQDRKAEEIIQKMRAGYPDGKVPVGEAPPPLPPELLTMQQERNAMVLRARDRLHEIYGEETFARLDLFVKSHVAPDIKSGTAQ